MFAAGGTARVTPESQPAQRVFPPPPSSLRGSSRDTRVGSEPNQAAWPVPGSSHGGLGVDGSGGAGDPSAATRSASHGPKKRRPASLILLSQEGPEEGPAWQSRRAPPITSWQGYCHVFIAHRTTTEGEEGGVRRRLCDAMMKISHSRPGMLWLLTEGYGRWPSHLEVPDGWVQHQVRIFQGSVALHCASDAQPPTSPVLGPEKLPTSPVLGPRINFEWFRAAKAFLSSQLFCPLLSWGDNDEGSVGQLMSIRPAQDKDRLDAFLLELALASYILKTDLGQVRVVFPVLFGSVREEGFTPFPLTKIDLLADEPSAETNKFLLGLLQQLGHVPEDEALVLGASVRSIVLDIVRSPGMQLSDAGQEGADRAIVVGASKVLDALVQSRTGDTYVLAAFAKPYTLELVTWLGECNILHYAPIFLQQAIDSLEKVKALTQAEMETLYNLHTKASGQPQRIGEVQSLIRLARELDSDPRSFPMSKRLFLFKDKEVSAVSALIATNPVHAAAASRLGKGFISLPPLWALSGVLLHFAWGYVFSDVGYLPCANLRDPLEPRRIWGSFLAWDIGMLAIELTSMPLIWGTNDPKYAYAAVYLTWLGPLILFLITTLSTVLECWLAGTGGSGAVGCEGGLGLVCFPWSYVVMAGCCAAQLYVLTYYERFFFMSLCFCTLSVAAIALTIEQLLTLNGRDPTIMYMLIAITPMPPFLGALLLRKYLKNRRYAFSLIDVAAYDQAWGQVLEMTSNGTIERLHDLLVDIGAVLERQRVVHYKKQPFFSILRELGEDQRTWNSRFTGGSSQKIRQPHSNIDKLFEDACQINATFHAWVSNAGLANGRTGTHIPGPAKKPVRAIEKLVRCYNRDAACLTDLVRCSLVCDSLEDVADCLLKLLSISEIGLPENTPAEASELQAVTRKLHDKYSTPAATPSDKRKGASKWLIPRKRQAWSAQDYKRHHSQESDSGPRRFMDVRRTESEFSEAASHGRASPSAKNASMLQSFETSSMPSSPPSGRLDAHSSLPTSPLPMARHMPPLLEAMDPSDNSPDRRPPLFRSLQSPLLRAEGVSPKAQKSPLLMPQGLSPKARSFRRVLPGAVPEELLITSVDEDSRPEVGTRSRSNVGASHDMGQSTRSRSTFGASQDTGLGARSRINFSASHDSRASSSVNRSPTRSDVWLNGGQGQGHEVNELRVLYSQLIEQGGVGGGGGSQPDAAVKTQLAEPDGRKKSPWMRIVEIKDRHFTDSGSAGYRDCNIKVEVAWDRADPSTLLPIKNWDELWRRHAETNRMASMVCEIQLLLSPIYHLKMSGSHRKYVQFRNIIT